jgi:hypothetical protein
LAQIDSPGINAGRGLKPSAEAELSQLHTTVQDALDYFNEVKPGVKVEVPDGLI